MSISISKAGWHREIVVKCIWGQEFFNPGPFDPGVGHLCVWIDAVEWPPGLLEQTRRRLGRFFTARFCEGKVRWLNLKPYAIRPEPVLLLPPWACEQRRAFRAWFRDAEVPARVRDELRIHIGTALARGKSLKAVMR